MVSRPKRPELLASPGKRDRHTDNWRIRAQDGTLPGVDGNSRDKLSQDLIGKLLHEAKRGKGNIDYVSWFQGCVQSLAFDDLIIIKSGNSGMNQGSTDDGNIRGMGVWHRPAGAGNARDQGNVFPIFNDIWHSNGTQHINIPLGKKRAQINKIVRLQINILRQIAVAQEL